MHRVSARRACQQRRSAGYRGYSAMTRRRCSAAAGRLAALTSQLCPSSAGDLRSSAGFQQPVLATVGNASAHAPGAPHILVGTYTSGEPVTMEDGSTISFTSGHADGAFLLRVDPSTGALWLADTVSEGIGENPSYALHSADTDTCYFTSEPGGVGMVKAFRVAREDGGRKLRFLNERATNGGAPCFLALTPRGVVLCANYTSGELTTLTTQADGALADVQTVKLPGAADTGFDATKYAGRQEASHAHCFVPDPAPGSDFAFACDLGSNEVVTVQVGSQGSMEFVHRCKLPEGTGPRHLAISQGGTIRPGADFDLSGAGQLTACWLAGMTSLSPALPPFLRVLVSLLALV